MKSSTSVTCSPPKVCYPTTVFDELKHQLTHHPVLAYFDAKKPVLITCDASKSGFGAVLIQNGQPIAYASRILRENEVRWAQIEKEMEAVVFACTKFHDYIFNKSVTVDTDHKHLVTIFKKSLDKAPARLQNMLMKLQKYNLEVIYKRGKDMHLTDALSRVHIPGQNHPDESIQYEVLTVNPISPTKYTDKSQNDTILSQFVQVIAQVNWPAKFQSCPEWLKPFFPFRDELYVDTHVVMRGTKIIIPKSLCNQYMQQLHKNHMSADLTNKLARGYFYWPKISEDIHNFVDKCDPCNSTKPKNPMIMLPIPERPWQILSTDVFEWDNKLYSVLVDLYSGWFGPN